MDSFIVHSKKKKKALVQLFCDGGVGFVKLFLQAHLSCPLVTANFSLVFVFRSLKVISLNVAIKTAFAPDVLNVH